MTTRKHLKRQVRERAAASRQPYTSALRSFRRFPQEVSMSDLDVSDDPVLAMCSFCKKDNRQVEKLIAGPGVYICNECVGLCGQIIEDTTNTASESDQRAQFLNRPADELLALLPALARTAAEVEADLRRWVLRLRHLDTGWDRIAATLDLGEEEARQRFEGRP